MAGAGALLLSACAPTVQSALRPPEDWRGPHFEADRFVSFDGARLGLSVWKPPQDAEPWAVVIGLHGMNDYAETFYLAGPYWAERGIATYAYDARGFGRSPERGLWPGEDLMAEDLRTAVAVARRRHPHAVIAVVGVSMGAAEAIVAFGSDDPPAADRLVLVAPAVWGWSALPMAYSVSLWTGAHTFPRAKVTPPKGLKIIPSDNNAMLRKIGRDKNMLFETRIDAVYGLVSLMDDAAEDVGRVRAPTAFLFGARDQIVPRHAAITAARRLPPGSRTALYPKGYHMLLRDLQAETVWADVVSFLQDTNAPFPSGVGPLVGPPADARETLTSAR